MIFKLRMRESSFKEFKETEMAKIRTFNMTAMPLRQPERLRNKSSEQLSEERACITLINDVFQCIELTESEKMYLVWLAGFPKYPVEQIISAFKKKMETIDT